MLHPSDAPEALTALIETIKQDTKRIHCTGISGAQSAFVAACAFRKSPGPMAVIAPTVKDAENFVKDFRFFTEMFAPPVLFFPTYNLLPNKSLSYHNEIAAKRIQILYQLIEEQTPHVLVTTVGALMQKIIPRNELSDFAELLMVNEDIDLDRLIEKMNASGYMRTTIVEEPGDYSVRGGIVDVFSPIYDDPLRIELFGDTVDSLRFFSAASQRKIGDIREAVILPAREVILKKAQLDQIISRIRQQTAVLDIPPARVRDVIDRIKNEGVFPGIERLMPLIYPELDTLFDYISSSSRYVLLEPSQLKAAAESVENQAANIFVSSCKENKLCVAPEKLYHAWADIEKTLPERRTMYCNLLPISSVALGQDEPHHIHFKFEDNLSVRTALENSVGREKPLIPLVEWISEKKHSGMVTVLVCGTVSQSERLNALLYEYNVDVKKLDGFPDVSRKLHRERGPVYVCLGRISAGFVWLEHGLAIITEDEIFGKKRRRRKVSHKNVRTELLAVEDLKIDDLIVHAEHGIGTFCGLTKLIHAGVANDYILIRYRDDDKLYLPVDRMNLAKKYVGVEGIIPVLDKMGGKTWTKAKENAKASVEKIAGELLKLYAARKVNSGHAFSVADSYFRDFEAGFEYEETPDQLKAINDVLDDMEVTIPMDRLVCGDVGYGKTEVALRASFKAVGDSKQTAMLVPTTVLAEQHYATFLKRFEKYPVNIACLNRFRSPKQQREIVADLKNGKIDIVIGTHRLLQKDIAFQSIGLIIIDEEQRFGVKHKEKLKELRKTVDVLALTATPIPRTLHMSLMGVRDISIISTPPEDRHSIITYISEFEDGIIQDAVRKEVARDGQVFFIHNNIHSIWKIAGHLMKLLPEITIDVAHGRLKETELEKVMVRFMKKEVDMLVCTTIVESGLDIPSANTIIVNRADRFGLSQIYQLRGRVGRSDEQAYAYLFIPKDSNLSRDAQKRLKVLMEHSDLGSGFQIAMSDLQIRGGGTALGVSQSGKIAAVGYDMFLELMERSIAELKGEPIVEELEPEINTTMSSYIPEEYVPDIDQRLSVYRRLAKMNDVKEIAVFRDELTDRFGKLPDEAKHLLLKIMLKVMAKQAGVKRLDLDERRLVINFSEIHQKRPFRIVDLIAQKPDVYQFTPEHVFIAKMPNTGPNAALALTKTVLKDIARYVNG